ncbi:LCP family protein [Candidatus Uhrbacteria bacterium]|nr:LCP family protein [Candidatus Uhrbacteria bacterium]
MRNHVQVDFLNPEHDRAARRTTIAVAVFFTLSVGVLSAIGAGASYLSVSKGTNVLMEIGNLPVIGDIRRLVLGENQNAGDAITTPDGRMNVMLFGVGGPGHHGSELTDTIILASVNTQAERVALLSIPRDLAFPLGGARFQKINAVNAYAEQDHPGQGTAMASKEIGKLFGVRIDHSIKVDFKGFETFIDALGGLDLTVERGFTDYSYPTLDDKWQTVGFKEGPQHMDGATALRFVRSRHGTNGEGGDFARSRRQQLVIRAVREKLLSRGVLTNPGKIAELWGIVSSHVQTDLSPWDLVKMAPLALRVTDGGVTTNVLTDEPDGELVPANVDGAFMLFPKKPDWSELQRIAQNPFATKEERAQDERPSEVVRVEIKNGTVRGGFAGQVSALLKKQGYTVVGTGNAVRRGYERTVIFDLTGGKKTTELARLKKLLHANVSTVLPSWASETSTRIVYSDELTPEPVGATATEFLVILGESSLGLVDPYATE